MKAFKVYPFAIAAGFGAQVLLAEGSYFRVKTATGDVGISFDDNTNLGPINAGQGFKVHGGYKRLTLTDMSGAANTGTIIVAGDDFVDQQLSGVVSVIDGGKARTLAGGSFMGVATLGNLAANFATVGISNPAASGKNVIVKAYRVSPANASDYIYSGFTQAIPTTDNGPFPSKKGGGTTSTARSVAQQLGAFSFAAAASRSDQTGASVNQTVSVPLQEPLVIAPGWAYIWQPGTAANGLSVTLEFNEESQ